MTTYARRSSRVLLLDSGDRILLIRSALSPPPTPPEATHIPRQTTLERDHYQGHHWWTMAELATTTETIYPFELLNLLTDINAGRWPTTSVKLPWHHA